MTTPAFNKKLQTSVWNEHSCIHGCVHNDIVSQEALYRKFYPPMMAVVARYTSDKDEAMSILNNGFLKVFKNIESYKSIGSLEGWIRTIIIHSISDYFRYKHPAKEVSFDTLPSNDNYNVPPVIQYDYKLLLSLLEELPRATRTVINLFIIDGYTHKQIAAIMGISENTSKWHVAEGKKILQKKIMPTNK